MTGKFITLEGGDGSGKSTQARLLSEALRASGRSAIHTREPGGTPAAEIIRGVLMDRGGDLKPISHTLLHLAARAEHVMDVVRPALEAGTWVVCDRYSDSTVAYQGTGLGVPANFILNVQAMMFGTFAPDLTLILDVRPEVGLRRARGRAGQSTYYDDLDVAFHGRVRAAYRTIAAAEHDRCRLIDGDRSEQEVHRSVMSAVLELDEVATVAVN